VADYEQPINTEIMKAVASRVTEKSDVLLLTAVDMDDSGPYEIAEPRVITALETYTPSCKFAIQSLQYRFSSNTFIGLQTPRLKRLAEIVSAQAIAQQEKLDNAAGVVEEDEDQEQAQDDQGLEQDAEENVEANGV
jgi:myosin-5